MSRLADLMRSGTSVSGTSVLVSKCFSNVARGRLNLAAVLLLGMLIGLSPSEANGQKKEKKGVATIRGKIAYDKTRIKSWEGSRLVVPYKEIQAKIRQKVEPKVAPYPKNFAKFTNQDKLQWEKNFIATAAGKKLLAENKKLIEGANAFDVKFEKDGKFVIYDVPYGTYGIQGRIDKEIDGKFYAFEVFGEIPVINGMDDIPLKPMRVEVTPLIKKGETAPPVAVRTHDNKLVLKLDHKAFKGKMVFLNFWTSESPSSVAEQQMVQTMYAKLKKKHSMKLISICVDGNGRDPSKTRKASLQYIIKNKLKEGSHGFTDGVEHRTIFDYGVRSFPSFCLIGTDGKVMMSQFEVSQAMRVKPDLETIVEDRISGKDAPTPASPGKAEGGSESKDEGGSKSK